MKYFLLLLLFAVTVLVSATNGHPSRGAKTFLARLNQNLNKVCAKVNSLEREVDALSDLEDQVTQLGDAVSGLTQQVIEQGNMINDLLEGQNTPGTVSIVNITRPFDFSQKPYTCT